MIARWLGIGLAVVALLLAGSGLSCLASDLGARPLDESATLEPAVTVDIPVDFEIDYTAPGRGPVLTR